MPIGTEFQSTLLMRGATRRKTQACWYTVFQSTLLMRGATRRTISSRSSRRWHFNPRSSCEERPADAAERAGVMNFNPRSSCEERRLPAHNLFRFPEFQSTLLMRGATRHRFPLRTVLCISIHAPHARSDDDVVRDAVALNRISIHAPHARSDPETVYRH